MLYEISLKNNMKEIDYVEEIEYMDGGTPIKLKLTINRIDRTAIFDFEGTGVQVNYSFNSRNYPTLIAHFL
jgi:5-oxoprolinase (ATP-hydrolysing)